MAELTFFLLCSGLGHSTEELDQFGAKFGVQGVGLKRATRCDQHPSGS
jgi:hypothetical protein